MNKKLIALIIAIVILVAVAGVVYFANKDNLNKKDVSLNETKNIETADKEENNQNVLEENTNTQNEQANNIENNKVEDNTNNNTEKKGKILVAYFSRADENYNVGNVEVGNTEIMAGFIKDYLGEKADTFKIDPVNAYPANYKECTEVATKELNSNARPEFKNADNLNIDNYDTIFIGYPIWWGDVPMIINTFLEKYDFSGKTIIAFNTHEGSGNSGTYTKIKNKMSTATVNTNGLAIQGKTARQESSRSTVENWLRGLGY